MRFRRRTVIREREVVVTEEAHDDPPWQATPVTWTACTAPAIDWTARYDPGPAPPAPLAAIIDPDPARRVPVPIDEPPRIGNRLVRHPPVTAPWRAHLGFTADLAARAARQDTLPWQAIAAAVPTRSDGEAAALREQFLNAARGQLVTLPPGEDPPVPYPALEEDTLAGEFEPLELLP